jgi:predicted TIM-barrel fold metal-dependent hydrolase
MTKSEPVTFPARSLASRSTTGSAARVVRTADIRFTFSDRQHSSSVTLEKPLIMWAIDYPYQPTAPAVAFIESAPMSETHREQIAHKNAQRIFRITPRN